MEKEPPQEEAPSNVLQSFVEPRLVILFTVLIILITYLLSRRFKKSENSVLLVGSPFAGKTAIIARLVFNEPNTSTVTSIQVSKIKIDDLNLVLYDLPGSPRTMKVEWEQYIPKARHVIYVLDSTTAEDSVRRESDLLYSLLNDPVLNKRGIGFTIACHKQDLEAAKKKDVLKELLEKEMDEVRKVKSRELGKTSDQKDEDFIAKKFPKGSKLSLDQLNVDMIETSIYNLDHLIRKLL